MKNTDKVTMTVGQLKKLVKESKRDITHLVNQIIEDLDGSTTINDIAWDVDEGRLSENIFTDPQFLQEFGRKLTRLIRSERKYINS